MEKTTKAGVAYEKVDQDGSHSVSQNDEELAGGGLRTSTEDRSATTPSPLSSRGPNPAPVTSAGYDTAHLVPPPAYAQVYGPPEKSGRWDGRG